MIRETRLLIEPADIPYVELACTSCKGCIRHALDSEASIPRKCPHCGCRWPEADPIKRLLDQFFSVTTLLSKDHAAVRLQLQVPDIERGP